MNKKLLLTFFLSVLFIYTTKAESTFDQLITIFQSNCASCHGGSNPVGNLNFNASSEVIYAALVGAEPLNPHAKEKGYQIIRKGYPRSSFLFRKINHGLDEGIVLDPAEGQAMPQASVSLTDVEKELVRQWILFGAPDTGQVVNKQVLIDFYVNGEGIQKINMPPAPHPEEGVQLHFGPIFVKPGDEVEYSIKRELGFQEDYDVVRLDVIMNPESHHLAMYKIYEGKADIFPDGLRLISEILDAAGIFFNADVVSQWANSYDLRLPAEAAFRWGEEDVMDISYHILNFTGKIMAAEAYVNIYFEPSGSREREMLSKPIYYGGDNVNQLVIPNDGIDTTFTWHHFYPNADYYWEVWSMMAHTHQLGKDYNVWLRNPDGTKGEKIYKGTYDPTYTFDQGFFDWAHPPIREFDPLLKVDMRHGLIHEATFNNTGPETVGFGLTTEDEMFVTYMHYLKTYFTSVEELKPSQHQSVEVYPNPSASTFYFRLPESFVNENTYQFAVYDLSGKKYFESTGLQKTALEFNPMNLSSSVYLYKFVNGAGETKSGRFVVK